MALGWLLLIIRGHAFVLMRFPAGHDWFEYLADAWMAWHRIDLGYPTLRGALYPFVLAALGERIGYAHAALLLSSISMLTVVAAAGLGARALAGPWAGAVAAASIPLVNLYAESSRWVNLYPTLAAVFGATLALGACAARWPRAGLALATGLAGGLSAGLDARGLLAWASAALLVGVGASRLPSTRPRVLLAALFLLGSMPGPMAARAVALKPAMAAPAHSIILRRDAMPMFRNRPELAAACGHEPAGEPLSLEALRRPCARALLRYNAGVLDRFLPFGLWGSLALLGMALLPGRSGWRGSVASAAVLGSALPLLLLPSLWVVLPDRYLFPVAVPLMMLPPVGAARALRSVWPAFRPGNATPAPQRLRVPAPDAPPAASTATTPADALAVLLIAAWLLHLWAGLPPVERLESHVLWAAKGEMIMRIQDLVRPGDTLLDCSSMAIEAALLPRRFHVDPPSLSGVDLERCGRWLEAPEHGAGAAWIVTGVRCEAPPVTPAETLKTTATEAPGTTATEAPGTLKAVPPGAAESNTATPTGPSSATRGAASSPEASPSEPPCHPALVPREARPCAHGLEPWRCSRCSFEARAGHRWVLVFEAVKRPDRDGSLQLWRWAGDR
jgi:hypothetical protein